MAMAWGSGVLLIVATAQGTLVTITDTFF